MRQTVVEVDVGCLFLTAISNGASLSALAATTCDTGLVAHEMTMLVERVRQQMTPEPRVPHHGVRAKHDT